MAQNLGAGMRFDKESDPLPMTFKAGGALNLARGWLVAYSDQIGRFSISIRPLFR